MAYLPALLSYFADNLRLGISPVTVVDWRADRWTEKAEGGEEEEVRED